MSEPQHERPEPYSQPPRRKADPKPVQETLTAIVLGAVLIAGGLTVSAGRRHAAPTPAEPPAPVSTPVQAPAPAPSPAVLPVSAPSPLDAMARFLLCRPYDRYQLDTRSASVDASQLLEEAACLCGLAGVYTVRVGNSGIQPYTAVAACPAGSSPMPLGPDAKQWKGEWIDEPGHKACVCSTDAREMRVIVINK